MVLHTDAKAIAMVDIASSDRQTLHKFPADIRGEVEAKTGCHNNVGIS